MYPSLRRKSLGYGQQNNAGQYRDVLFFRILAVSFIGAAASELAMPVNVVLVDFDSSFAYSTDPSDFFVSSDTYFIATSGVGIDPSYINIDGDFLPPQMLTMFQDLPLFQRNSSSATSIFRV